MSTKIIKPYIDVDKKEILVKLNFLTGLTIKEICADLLDHAVSSNYAMFITHHFKRSVTINKLQFPAQNPHIPFPDNKKEITRITINVSDRVYEYANSLYYATDISIPKILAAMITYSMNDDDYFNKYITEYLSRKIDDERKRLLLSILKDVNQRTENEHNIASLIFYIADEFKEIDESLEDSVDKVASQWTVTK